MTDNGKYNCAKVHTGDMAAPRMFHRQERIKSFSSVGRFIDDQMDAKTADHSYSSWVLSPTEDSVHG